MWNLPVTNFLPVAAVLLAVLGSFAIRTAEAQSNNLEVDDQCRMRRTSSPGVCRLILDCPSAIADIRRRINPTRCGWAGRTEIVCCPLPPTQPPLTQQVTNNRFAGDADFAASISATKCRDYASAVFETSHDVNVEGQRIERNISVCSMDSEPLIVGGVETRPWEFPHMALLSYDDGGGVLKFGCGGTLISEEFVLTAAHCIRTQRGPPVRISLGVHSKSNTINPDNPLPDRTQSVAIAALLPHPGYNRSRAFYDDIALIRLQRPLQLSPYIRPACLPTAARHGAGPAGSHTSAVASGWGQTEFHGSESDRLQKVELDLYTAEECNGTYTRPYMRKMWRGVDAQRQLCAGSRLAAKDTCQGDSGGPLQVQTGAGVFCSYTVLGVTSFGRGCGGVNVPNVYTRVLGYVPWIEGIVWPSSASPVSAGE